LTGFYLAIAIGGSLGGMFVALLAPLLFISYAELPLLMLLVPVLLLAAAFRDLAERRTMRVPAWLLVVPVAAFCGAGIVVLKTTGRAPRTVDAVRNFYGRLTVVDDDPAQDRPLRGLYHGRVLHGAQFLNSQWSMTPTTYYAKNSGIDVAIGQHTRRLAGLPLSVGVVGLGAGTIAAWGAAGDRFRFFELNPEVATFARRDFTFLSRTAASPEVVIGDARLSLEHEMAELQHQHTYDVLAIDAFAGDSIPVHLLTRECLALYRQALKVDGVLAVHVSNRYLDLRPVVRGLSSESGLHDVEIDRQADTASGAWASVWMLVSADEGFIRRAQGFGRRPEKNGRTLIWTDSFSSLISVVR
jgi:hypothetical protein